MGNINSAENEAKTTGKPSMRLEPFNVEKPSFDPMYGFPNGRKKREMQMTTEEMKSSKVILDRRDYCAHKLVQFNQCKREKMPFVYKCHHEKHDYLNCEYDDYVLRMKEFEREKRLRAREYRILSNEIRA